MPLDEAELRRWLEKADRDHRSAVALIAVTPAITDTAAFHCQQAVEKYLKAYLFSQGIDFERTHDLHALVLLCSDRDASFLSMRDRAATLTPYAVRFRYPGPVDPTVEAVQAAIAIVNEIAAFVRARV